MPRGGWVANVWQLRPEDRQASPADTAPAVEGFFRELSSLLELDLNADVSVEAGKIVVNLSGGDRPLLLASTAALLNSLEYLANKVFRTGKDSTVSSIQVGSDNYRQHREAELVLLAQMASKKVIAQRRPLNLQPMVPRERRIIHLALAAIEGVRSESIGEGDNRSITIYPTD